MLRHRNSTFLAGLVLLLTVGCSGYSGSYTAPPQNPYDAPQYSDARIHNKVHRALDRAPALRHLDLGVYVENCNVYLSGKVHSYHQKELAHEIAHSVDGVQRVFTRDIRVYG